MFDTLFNNDVTEEQAIFVFCELVLVVYYLHSLGLIQRYLKPDNDFITADGNVVLGDFGFITRLSAFNERISERLSTQFPLWHPKCYAD